MIFSPKNAISCLGVGAVLALANIGAMPEAGATPSDTDAEQNFFYEVYEAVRPPVNDQVLLQLGNQTCSVRRGGGSTNDAKFAVWKSLEARGVMSSNAEIGSLVHAAVDTLCPEVGYP